MYRLYKELKYRKRKNYYDIDLFKVIIRTASAMVCLLLLFTFSFGKGESMSPTLKGERPFAIVVKKGTPISSRPKVGEIWAFTDRQGENDVIGKRVVAYKGDSLYVENDVLMRNEEPVKNYPLIGAGIEFQELDTNYSPDELKYNFLAIKKGKPKYFVMGDNYMNSLDSRDMGAMSEEEVIGRMIVPSVVVSDAKKIVNNIKNEVKLQISQF